MQKSDKTHSGNACVLTLAPGLGGWGVADTWVFMIGTVFWGMIYNRYTSEHEVRAHYKIAAPRVAEKQIKSNQIPQRPCRPSPPALQLWETVFVEGGHSPLKTRLLILGSGPKR